METTELSKGAKMLIAWIGNRTQESVATQLGVQVSHLNHWIKGRRTPGLDHAVKIEDMTLGAVPARAWVE